jgi:hypothetical protein
VEIIFLPPNCTLVYQPLDQGIISTLKTLLWMQTLLQKHKSEMLSEFVNAYDNFDELQAKASQVK